MASVTNDYYNALSLESPVSAEASDDFSLSKSDSDLNESNLSRPTNGAEPLQYRLYKRRFSGVVGIVFLNIAAGMNWPWFGPIANNVADDFGITLDQVNWLGNIIALTYIFVSPLVPILCSRYGLRFCFYTGAIILIAASWVRFAGNAPSLSVGGAYTLLLIGQFMAAISQAIFQILAPKYSETWFDTRGRTTATMVMSIANPIGGALGQLISPLAGDTRDSILVLGIISTVTMVFVFLISSAPPTPPTYAGSIPSPSLLTTLRAIIGKHPSSDDQGVDSASYMHLRERIDFIVLTMIFGTMVAAVNSFSLQSAQILQPYGYSADTAGFMGAALLISGIVAAIITSPLFDRVITHHLGIAVRIFTPIVAMAWLSLIWAVRPDNTAALYAIFVIIGVFSISMLPVGLELGCELTRNADTSSAILWGNGNLLGIVFVLVESALRAGPEANPPLNLHRSLIFQGIFATVVIAFIFVFRGKQARRSRDVQEFTETHRDPT